MGTYIAGGFIKGLGQGLVENGKAKREEALLARKEAHDVRIVGLQQENAVVLGQQAANLQAGLKDVDAAHTAVRDATLQDYRRDEMEFEAGLREGIAVLENDLGIKRDSARGAIDLDTRLKEIVAQAEATKDVEKVRSANALQNQREISKLEHTLGIERDNTRANLDLGNRLAELRKGAEISKDMETLRHVNALQARMEEQNRAYINAVGLAEREGEIAAGARVQAGEIQAGLEAGRADLAAFYDKIGDERTHVQRMTELRETSKLRTDEGGAEHQRGLEAPSSKKAAIDNAIRLNSQTATDGFGEQYIVSTDWERVADYLKAEGLDTEADAARAQVKKSTPASAAPAGAATRSPAPPTTERADVTAARVQNAKPVPANQADYKVGEYYRSRSGVVAEWTGTGFRVIWTP